MRVSVIHKGRDLTITKEFVALRNNEVESVSIADISTAWVTRHQVGNYKAGAVLFFILGVLSIWFLIGFLFLALGVAAWMSKIYEYKLRIRTNAGREIVMSTSKRRRSLQSLAMTINGLVLSRKVNTFTAT